MTSIDVFAMPTYTNQQFFEVEDKNKFHLDLSINDS